METSLMLVAGFFLTATVSSLPAQTPDAPNSIPPPQPPLVVRVPDRAQWTITLAYEGDDQDLSAKSPTAKPKHSLHQIVCTKTQNLKREVEIYEDGTSETFWFSGDLILLPQGNGHDVGIVDFEKANRPVYGEGGNPTESPGFTGVGWLQLRYYDKVVMLQSVPCYHYALNSKAPASTSGLGDMSNDMETWINAKTGFPVAYRTGGITYAYAFGVSPESDLVLPDPYAQALKAHQQIEDRRKQLEKDLGG